jgi:hypothetical protein
MMSGFAEFIWEWGQLRSGFNWRTFHLVMIEVEDDRMCGAVEVTVVALGVGVRARWTYDSTFTRRMAEEVEAVEAAMSAALTPTKEPKP